MKTNGYRIKFILELKKKKKFLVKKKIQKNCFNINISRVYELNGKKEIFKKFETNPEHPLIQFYIYLDVLK